MYQAAELQFERAVHEYKRWRAVPEDERSPAPGWWWASGFEMRDVQRAMPAEWCSSLQLADGCTFADGARVFLTSLASQTSLSWPDDFPRRLKHSEPA
jgi:hypothetical protein